MTLFRFLTSVYAVVIAISVSPAAYAATYLMTYYEHTGTTIENLFDDFTIAGTGTFTIADSAVTPNNLVMFSDPEFLSFETSLTLSRGDSSTFTLGVHDFQLGDPEERGILFDGNGDPYRFELPGSFVSDALTMCDASCDLSLRFIAYLTLNDFDDYQEVYLDDGTITRLSAISPGTPYTSLAGTWTYAKGVDAGGSGVQEVNGRLQITEISAVPIPPAFILFGSGILGLIGIARRKKTA